MTERERYLEDVQQLEAQLFATQDKLAAALALLREIEQQSYRSGLGCPACHNPRDHHLPVCRLAALLKEA